MRQISKVFASNETAVHALKAIDLTLSPRDRMAIVGTSGSGKSTLMAIMGLLDVPSSGEYLLNGTLVNTLSPNERARMRNEHIGFVFQSFHLLPRMTALDNVMQPLLYRKLSSQEARIHAKEALEMVGLAERTHHRPNELSGGQQQRVAIARALVTKPTLLLADEPTGALDSETSKEIMDLLISLNENADKTLVIITHDHTVSKRCHRISTMQDGELRDGT